MEPCCAGSRSTPRRGSPTPRRRPRWSTRTWTTCGGTWSSTAGGPTRCRTCTRTSCTAQAGRAPRGRGAAFRVYSGMDLDYWQGTTCWARRRTSPTGSGPRSRRSAASTTCAEPAQLGSGEPRAARDGRPAEGGGLIVAAGVTSPLPPYLRPDRLEDALAILATEPRAGRRRRHRCLPRARLAADRPAGARHHGAPGAARRDGRRGRLADPGPHHLDRRRGGGAPARARRAARGGPHDRRAADPERRHVCGNVVNASPAADGLPNLLALDALVEVASADGERVVPIADFVLGSRRTDLRAGELVTGLRIPTVNGGGSPRRASPGRRSSSWGRGPTS